MWEDSCCGGAYSLAAAWELICHNDSSSEMFETFFICMLTVIIRNIYNSLFASLPSSILSPLLTYLHISFICSLSCFIFPSYKFTVAPNYHTNHMNTLNPTPRNVPSTTCLAYLSQSTLQTNLTSIFLFFPEDRNSFFHFHAYLLQRF